MKLSKKALEVLNALFGEKSSLQFPVSLVDNIIEIREEVKKELEDLESKVNLETSPEAENKLKSE